MKRSKRQQKRDIQVTQTGLNFIRRTTMDPVHEMARPFIAKVTEVYSDRMTCDLETFDRQRLPNIPVMTKGGLVDGAPYGELCLPALDDYVVVIHASYGQNHKVIVGTILPYLNNQFIKDAVNSSSKASAKTVLESDVPLEYRRIFKSGASVQIEEDGTITVEAPDGSIVKIGAGSSGITVDDANGNNITMGASSVTVNGNLEVLQ